jgi:hypothetical protein
MPKSLKRILSDASLQEAKEHTAVQGEIIYAANRLHDAFFRTFVISLALNRTEAANNIELQFNDHALSMWHVLQSDSNQRDLALASISNQPTGFNLKPAVHRLKWAKEKAQQLSVYRNIVAHTQVLFENHGTRDNPKLVPAFRSFSMRPAHLRRVIQLSSLAVWRGIRNDLIRLAEYIEDINNKIIYLDSEHRGLGIHVPGDKWHPISEFEFANGPWPDRPRLQWLARLQALDRTLDQAKPHPKRRSRHRSSRA